MKLISMLNKEYPNILKNIDKPPKYLYTEGNIDLLKTNAIAIIGSRHCSEEGRKIARKMAKELAIQGITIVSGLAVGIDSEAHKGALEVGGNTIAVLGSGLNKFFPEENLQLFQEIKQRGLVVTEYSENVKVKPGYFLKRNRIVSGLSLGVLVVEAAHRSGTSVTAKLALEQGRKVFSIPHDINNYLGVGTNRLISKGAKLVTNSREIIEEFNFLKYDKEKVKSLEMKKPVVKKEYQEVFNLIGQIPIRKEEIYYKTKKKVQEIDNILLMLELDGFIKKVAGGYVWKKEE